MRGGVRDSSGREKLEKAAADAGKSVYAFLNDLIQKNV